MFDAASAQPGTTLQFNPKSGTIQGQVLIPLEHPWKIAVLPDERLLITEKPGRLRWTYLDPSTEDIYVDRDDVKVYVPEHKQVLVGKLTQMAASKAPLELLQGAAKLEESFSVEPTPGKGRGVGGIRLLTLVPKSHEGEAHRSLQKIVVEVFPNTYFIRSLSLYEISGNVSNFEFSSLQANVGLGNDLFIPKLPADVEVVKAPVLSQP